MSFVKLLIYNDALGVSTQVKWVMLTLKSIWVAIHPIHLLSANPINLSIFSIHLFALALIDAKKLSEKFWRYAPTKGEKREREERKEREQREQREIKEEREEREER